MTLKTRTDYEYDVFLSYASKDKAKVLPIYTKLLAYSIRVFWSPIDNKPGTVFPQELSDALQNSQHFIVYWSEKTRESQWVLEEWTSFLQLHVSDRENRQMFVLLDSASSKKEVPAFLKNKTFPDSSDSLVDEMIKAIVPALREQLDSEQALVKEAQKYYGRNRFWGPISNNGDVHIFTCARDIRYDGKTMRGQGGRTNIDMWDYRSVLDITHFFALNYPNAKVTFEDPISKLHNEDLQDPVGLATHMAKIVSMLENKDCIIIGSPDVSDFAELALASIHDISPYAENRAKSKGFVIIKDIRKPMRSSFYWQKEGKEPEGVAQIISPDNDEHFIQEPATADGVPGTMHGILIVANNPFCRGGQSRKIIILSGFSGVATNGIAKLLTDEACMDEFFKLDNAYPNIDQDFEALVGVKYIVYTDHDSRDTRRIPRTPDAITFERLVEI